MHTALRLLAAFLDVRLYYMILGSVCQVHHIRLENLGFQRRMNAHRGRASSFVAG